MGIDAMQAKSEDYVARGWWIFPCRPGRKEPVGGRGFHDASSDASIVTAWWQEQPDCNVGLHLGKSNLFALDIETTEHPWLDKLKIDCTFVQATANGGWHFVFEQPEGMIVPSVPLGQLDDQAEIKGDGGYILLAPSALFGSVAKLGHPTGYQIVHDSEPAQAPSWLLDFIVEHMQKSSTQKMQAKASSVLAGVSGLQNLTAQDRVQQLLDTVSSAVPGTRSNTLISVSASMGRVVGGGYITHGEAAGLLEAATVGAGWESPNKTLKTIQRGLEAGEAADAWFPDEVGGLSDEYVAELVSSLGSVSDGLEAVLVLAQDEEAAADVGQQEDAGDAPCNAPSGLALVGGTLPQSKVIPEGPPKERDALRQELADRVAQLSPIAGDFMSLAKQCAIYWQPGFAIGGAVALGSVLGARRLIWPGRNPLTTSAYVLIAGGSGDGKSTAKAPVDMCLELWPELIGGNSLASFQANFESIRTAAENGHGQLWVLDEYYRIIESMTGPKAASFNIENRGLLLEMATINTGTYRRKKSKLDSKDGHQFEVVHAPGFSLMALSATEKLFEVLGKGSVADGYLPRHVLFMPQSVLPRKSRGRPPVISQRLASAIADAVDIHKDWVDGLGVALWRGVPVVPSDEAVAILEGFGDALDSERRKSKPAAPEAVLARGEEQAMRISMCLAALAQAGQQTIKINAETAYLACDIAAMSMADVSYAVSEHTSETVYEAHLARLRQTIERLAGPGGWVPWSRVLGALRLGGTDYLGKMAGHLVAAEQAEVAEYKNPKGGPVGKKIRLLR